MGIPRMRSSGNFVPPWGNPSGKRCGHGRDGAPRRPGKCAGPIQNRSGTLPPSTPDQSGTVPPGRFSEVVAEGVAEAQSGEWQGWLSKPSGKRCGSIQDKSGILPPSKTDPPGSVLSGGSSKWVAGAHCGRLGKPSLPCHACLVAGDNMPIKFGLLPGVAFH